MQFLISYYIHNGFVGWNYLSIPKLQRRNHWSLEMDELFHPTLHCTCDFYLSMLGLKLNMLVKWALSGKTAYRFIFFHWDVSVHGPLYIIITF